jgi:hypothetical protein
MNIETFLHVYLVIFLAFVYFSLGNGVFKLMNNLRLFAGIEYKNGFRFWTTILWPFFLMFISFE